MKINLLIYQFRELGFVYLTPEERGDMNWNELFFTDWSPDVIPALSVCFHAAAEVRSELATNTAGEKMVKKSSVETDKRKEV